MMRRVVPLFLLIAFSMFAGDILLAADAAVFEPVRAPSKGPHNAPVTIIEIADFM